MVTCSGGDSVITADEADRLGVPSRRAAPTPRAPPLARLLPDGVVVTNPLDHTNMLWADTPQVRALVEALAADPGVNQVLYVQDTPPDLCDADAAEWRATRDGLVVADIPGTGRAVASGLPELMPEAVAEPSWLQTASLRSAGIPTALVGTEGAHRSDRRRRRTCRAGRRRLRRGPSQVTGSPSTRARRSWPGTV